MRSYSCGFPGGVLLLENPKGDDQLSLVKLKSAITSIFGVKNTKLSVFHGETGMEGKRPSCRLLRVAWWSSSGVRCAAEPLCFSDSEATCSLVVSACRVSSVPFSGMSETWDRKGSALPAEL